jgi:hypothetical protein
MSWSLVSTGRGLEENEKGEEMTQEEQREIILLTVEDLVDTLLDRRDDEELPSGTIETAVLSWNVTIGEMAARFEQKLREAIPVPLDESGYDPGQAAHVVKMSRKHAAVAEMGRS